jgi:lipoyl-dependent peroxiredoxin
MAVKSAEASWSGSLMDGKGHVKSESGKLDVDMAWKDRGGEGKGTNPEEILGAAHAMCFSMALSHMLASAGHPPTSIKTKAEVSFEKVGDGFGITKILLKTTGQVPGIDEAKFKETAEKAKAGCPVSKALTGVEITLDAALD